MPVTLAIIGGGLAVAQAGFGTGQYLSAKKQDKRNTFTPYKIQPEYQAGVDTLTNTLGLPSSAIDYYYNRAGQAGSAGMNAILANGGNSNDIARLIRGQQQSFLDVMMKDALTKKQDIGQLLKFRLALANEKDKAYQLNIYDRYKDKADAISREKAAGIQNIGGAFNTAASFAAASATSNIAGEKTASSTATTPTSGVNYIDIAKSIDTSQMSPMSPQKGLMYFGQTPPTPSFDMFSKNGSGFKLATPDYKKYPLPRNYGNFNPSFGNYDPSVLSLYNNPYNMKMTPFTPSYY